MRESINKMYAQINEYRSYLNKTDYKAIKQSEIGVEIPEGVKDARQHARDEINRLEYEVRILEEALEEARAEQPEEEGL